MTITHARRILAQALRIENTTRLLPGEVHQIILARKVVAKHNKK